MHTQHIFSTHPFVTLLNGHLQYTLSTYLVIYLSTCLLLTTEGSVRVPLFLLPSPCNASLKIYCKRCPIKMCFTSIRLPRWNNSNLMRLHAINQGKTALPNGVYHHIASRNCWIAELCRYYNERTVFNPFNRCRIIIVSTIPNWNVIRARQNCLRVL